MCNLTRELGKFGAAGSFIFISGIFTCVNVQFGINEKGVLDRERERELVYETSELLSEEVVRRAEPVVVVPSLTVLFANYCYIDV